MSEHFSFECRTCAGCGQVANDDDRTPWSYWANLPLRSAGAVLAGLVRPLTCPDCGGSGDATAAAPQGSTPESEDR